MKTPPAYYIRTNLRNQGDFVTLFRQFFRQKRLFRLFQHIFYKYAVSHRRILYKYVRYRANQLSVLYDRAAAHPLDNASGFFQQFLVRHFYNQTLIDFCVRHVDICHLNIVLFDFIVDKAADRSVSSDNFFLFRSFYRNLFPEQFSDSVDCSIYPCIGIFVNGAQYIEIIVNNNSFHTSRITV